MSLTSGTKYNLKPFQSPSIPLGKIKVPSGTLFFFRSTLTSGREDSVSIQVHHGVKVNKIVTLLFSKLTIVVEVRLCKRNLDVGFVGVQF